MLVNVKKLHVIGGKQHFVAEIYGSDKTLYGTGPNIYEAIGDLIIRHGAKLFDIIIRREDDKALIINGEVV